jgi:hypothetical protein
VRFADQVALELGQGGEDVEDQTPSGRGGVDALLQRAEPHATVGERGHGFEQVP